MGKRTNKPPVKTWLGLPHAFLRRVIAVGVISFPFVGSSVAPYLKTKAPKPSTAPKCSVKSGEGRSGQVGKTKNNGDQERSHPCEP